MFQPFPKIARLNREIIITEKIDGTNAAIGIDKSGAIWAQSRTRCITPTDDNFGFARWVYANAEALAHLGPGIHFGEWWGRGIQRGYGLDHRVFSLFNTSRWDPKKLTTDSINYTTAYLGVDPETGGRLAIVPYLYHGPWMEDMMIPGGPNKQFAPNFYAHQHLPAVGSYAAPGFKDPEGIVVWHEHSRQSFKVTCQKDVKHKMEA